MPRRDSICCAAIVCSSIGVSSIRPPLGSGAAALAASISLNPAARASRQTAAPPAGHVREDIFFSAALGVRKHVMVYTPPSYDTQPDRRFPVVYFLHGLGGSESDWLAKGDIDGAADSLFAARTPEMIIVMPDGDDGWYTTWTHQYSYATCADTLHAEAPARYCVEHQRYDRYIATDVVSYIDTHYRTIADRAHRGIAGLSMGGYGAMMLALQYPNEFSAAASHSGVVSPLYVGPHPPSLPLAYADAPDDPRVRSGSFWTRYHDVWGDDITRWRDADPAHAAEALRRRGGPVPMLFIDCGVDDGFIDQNRAFHLELTRLGIPHVYTEWPGAHTWRYWSTHVRESLAWVGRQIGSR